MVATKHSEKSKYVRDVCFPKLKCYQKLEQNILISMEQWTHFLSLKTNLTFIFDEQDF